MPAFTSFIAGVSALGSVASVKQAKDTAGAAKARREKQAIEAREALTLEGQDKGLKTKETNVELGTSTAADALLKRTKKTKAITGLKPVCGLTKSAGKVGGL